MKKQSQLGLVIEGSATSSSILHVPKLADDLGPVKSGSLRVARRLSNVLRAGYAVEEYQDLQTAKLVLLCFPDNEVDRIIQEICSSGLVLRDMSFVLCESWLTADSLLPLAEIGASTATVVKLPTKREDWFAVEGQAKAVRRMRRFLQRSGKHSDELKAESKDLLFASQLLATKLPMSMLMMAQHSLRSSGFSGNTLSGLLEQMTLKMLQDFLRGARSMWASPYHELAPEVGNRLISSLERNHPDLAAYVNEQIRLANTVATVARATSHV